MLICLTLGQKRKEIPSTRAQPHDKKKQEETEKQIEAWETFWPLRGKPNSARGETTTQHLSPYAHLDAQGAEAGRGSVETKTCA